MRTTSNWKTQYLYHTWTGVSTESRSAAWTFGTASAKDDVRKGDRLTPLPYEASFSSVDTVNGFLHWRRSYPSGTTTKVDQWQSPLSYYSTGLPALPDGMLLASGLAGIVNTRLLSKAVSATNNIVLALADRKKTGQLAVSLAQSVYSLTVDFVRRDWESVSRTLTGAVTKSGRVPRKQLQAVVKASADRHLAFIYGVLPVINEVNGLISLNSRPLEGRVRARESRDIPYTHAVTCPRLNTGLNDRREDWVPAVKRRTVSRTISARGVFTFQLRSAALDHAAQLGVLSPRFAMYDQIALSFVAGWFSNISSYLVALDSGLSIEGLNYSTMARCSDLVTTEVYPLYPNGFKETALGVQVTHSFSGNSSATSTSTKYKRTVGKAPKASLHLRDNFSTFAGLASLSLFAQRYIGRLRKLQNQAPSTTNPAFSYKPVRVRTLNAIQYRKP